MSRGTIAYQSSPFALIMNSIRSQVATMLYISPEYVRVTANDDYVITQTEDLFIYIRVFWPRPYRDYGAGRLGRVISRRIRCYIYTRSGADLYGGDEYALMTASPEKNVNDVLTSYGTDSPARIGQFLAEELLLNALDDFIPKYQDAPLVVEPLHPINDDGPPLRRAVDEDGLIRSSLDFEIVYVSAINPVEPAPYTPT